MTKKFDLTIIQSTIQKLSNSLTKRITKLEGIVPVEAEPKDPEEGDELEEEE